MGKLEKGVLYFIMIAVIFMGTAATVQYVNHRLDSARINIMALSLELQELETAYDEVTSTDGYVVPEAEEYLVFPFSPDRGIFITSQFGLRGNPFEDNVGPARVEEKTHYGLDIVSTRGTAIYSTVSGPVVSHYPPPNDYWKGNGLYGGEIVIEDENGVYHKFSHLSETYVASLPEASRTYAIAGETVIGRQGDTGLTTGPHLHYEIFTGPDPDTPEEFYDPMFYFDILLDEDNQVMFPEEEIEPRTLQR